MKFCEKKRWIEVNDLSGCQYSTIRFKFPVLRSGFCNYNNACIGANGTIDLVK